MTVFEALYKKDRIGIIRSMAAADGYVMVRRPGCMPFVLSGKEWDRMPSPAEYDELAAAWKAAEAKLKAPDALPSPGYRG